MKRVKRKYSARRKYLIWNDVEEAYYTQDLKGFTRDCENAGEFAPEEAAKFCVNKREDTMDDLMVPLMKECGE